MNKPFIWCKMVLLVSLVQLMSCSKNNNPNGTASLTIINAVAGSNFLLTNFTGTDSITYINAYYNGYVLYYGYFDPNANQFGNHSGITKIGLYEFPDTTKHSAPLYNLSVDLPVNSIHTLFLVGTMSAPDTLFTNDVLPVHTDSTVGVRFVNLSPGSNPVNVTLSTNTGTNEVSGLAYKGVTSFRSYPVISGVNSYTFQFQDAVTGTILASYTLDGISNGTGGNTAMNQYRFRNVTIALFGLPNGTGGDAQQTLLINNY